LQGIVGKQDERQVDCSKQQKLSAGTQVELASGGSRTSKIDVNVNTEVLDPQYCQTKHCHVNPIIIKYYTGGVSTA